MHLVSWLGVRRGKFHDWKDRYGKVNEHNSWIPRDHWLEDWEKEAVIDYYIEHPFDGYRRLTFMMLDADVVAVSPASVYRVLRDAGLMEAKNGKSSKKGSGFDQPTAPHQHWHVDLAYLNLGGTFYYLCAVIDGYSRYIVHWDIMSSMTSADVQLVVQRAREMFPGTSPRVIVYRIKPLPTSVDRGGAPRDVGGPSARGQARGLLTSTNAAASPSTPPARAPAAAPCGTRS